MMKKIFLISCILLSLCSCKSSTKLPQQVTPLPTESPTATQTSKPTENEKKISQEENKGQFESMNKFEDCVYDITKSGDAEETIELLTDAEKDSGGEFMWDDSQKWALIVKNKNGIYQLYNDNSHAKPYINVGEVYEENGDIIPVIRLSISSSAGFEIREYRYENKIFIEKKAYQTGAINELSINKY